MYDVDNASEAYSPICVKYTGDTKPLYQTFGSAGADVFSSIDATIPVGKSVVIPTGLCIELPPGYECQVRSRSGLAAKQQVFVLNSPGTVDEDYRNEVGVILMNLGDSPFDVKKGDRIAQLVFSKVTRAMFVPVYELSSTDRKGGFGSTGR